MDSILPILLVVSLIITLYCVDAYRVISGMCITQVWAIFQLPEKYGHFPHPLIYIEWFTPFNTPVPDLHLYSISHSTHGGCHNASIIPVTCLEHIIHLLPKFGWVMNRSWAADDVLEKCSLFYVNSCAWHLDFLLLKFLVE